MNNLRGKCNHEEITKLQETEYSRPQERLKAFSAFNNVTTSEVEQRVEDLGVILLANSFFTHLFDQSLLDATHPQIKHLLDSETIYLRWSKSYSNPPSFENIKSKVNLLLPKL